MQDNPPIPAAASPGTEIKNKKVIIIAIAIALAFVIGIAIWFYYKGKKSGATNINISSPLTQEGTAPAASDSELKILATELHDDMNGLNLLGHDTTTWRNFQALSDADIIRLNNIFNMDYEADSGESFVEWVSHEKGYDPQTALVRLKKLNLK